MAVYVYTALDGTTGQEVRGELEALDAPSAAADLRRRSLFPVGLDVAPVDAMPAARRGSVLDVFRFTRTRDVVVFLRQLALMLRAGLTILQALDVARESSRKPGLARAIGRIRSAVESGRPLSEAFGVEGRAFPPIAARLVATAEASGELDATLDQVAIHIERILELKRSIIASLVYPSIVVLASLGVVVFLLTKVIPTFAKFLQRRQIPLPWATRALVDASGFLTSHGVWLGLAALVFVATLVGMKTRPRGRLFLDRVLLAVPVVGGVLTAAAMAQLGRTFATLLRGGVTLLESLRILAGTTLNAAVAAQLERAADGVLRGQDLTTGLRGATIPPLVSQVVSVGERTGALDHVFEEVGRFYEDELRTRVRQLSAMFEPCVIFVVGGLVGFVYFAFFQALLTLATRGH